MTGCRGRWGGTWGGPPPAQQRARARVGWGGGREGGAVAVSVSVRRGVGVGGGVGVRRVARPPRCLVVCKPQPCSPTHTQPTRLVLHQQRLQLGDAPQPHVVGGAEEGDVGQGAGVVELPHAAAGEQGGGVGGWVGEPDAFRSPPSAGGRGWRQQQHHPFAPPPPPRVTHQHTHPPPTHTPELVVEVVAALWPQVDVVGVKD